MKVIYATLLLMSFPALAAVPCPRGAVMNDEFYDRNQISIEFNRDLHLSVDEKIRNKLPEGNSLIPTKKFKENWISDRLGSPKRIYVTPSEGGIAVTTIPKGTVLTESDRPEHQGVENLHWAHEAFQFEPNAVKVGRIEILYFTNWGTEKLTVKAAQKLLGATISCESRN